MQSYNEIIALLGDMAASHGMVHSFHDGTEQVQLNGKANILYPAVFAKPEATLVKDKVVDHEFTLMACDLVTPAGRSRNEVLSDCQQILYDFLKAMQSLPQITILPGARIRPFEGRFGDDTAGQEMTIVLRMNFDQNLCNIPMTGFGFPGAQVSLSGTTGPTGTSGFSGYSGYSGYNGLNGVPGASGYSGQNGSGSGGGTSGYSGYSGSNGSGTSGYSGAQGISGYSGVTGLGTPASPNKSIQYNNSGVFGGSANLEVNNAVTNVILNAGAAIPLFAVSRDAGNPGGIAIGTNVASVPTPRWGIGANGSDDFVVSSYDDAGTFIIDNITVTRSSSNILIDGNTSGSVKIATPTKTVELCDSDVAGSGTFVVISDKAMTTTLESAIAVRRVESADADYAMQKGEFQLSVTTVTTMRTVTLPDVANIEDHTVIIIKCDSTAVLDAYLVIIPQGAETIDGGSHRYSYDRYESVVLLWNGAHSTWEVIASYDNIDKSGQIALIAEKSISTTSATTIALDWQTGKSYANSIPLFYTIHYTSGTLGIGVVKMKNSVMDMTGLLPLVNVTTSQEMSTDNNQAIIHPNSGDISVEITTATIGTGFVTVNAYGKKR